MYRQRHPYIAQVFYILKNRAKSFLRDRKSTRLNSSHP